MKKTLLYFFVAVLLVSQAVPSFGSGCRSGRKIYCQTDHRTTAGQHATAVPL